MTEFFAGVQQTRPRLLHGIAAQDPAAGGKCLYSVPIFAEEFKLPRILLFILWKTRASPAIRYKRFRLFLSFRWGFELSYVILSQRTSPGKARLFDSLGRQGLTLRL